jgi:outer membrane protein assembly factor BamB
LTDEPLEVYPGAWGGVLTPLAYADGRLFVPVVNQPTIYTASAYDPGSMFDLNRATGELVALDVLTGAMLWRQTFDSPAVGAATVFNDVVVTAGLDGGIRCVSTTTGTPLRQFWAGSGVNAPPAIAAGMLIVPAAGAWIRSEESPEAVDAAARPRVLTLGSKAVS